MKKKTTYKNKSSKISQAKEPQAVYSPMKSLKYIPEISPVVFWDVPKESINYAKDSVFIINRVFNYGNFQEVADIIICYGKKYVKEILLNSTELNIFGLEKASAFLGIPETQFKCYERKPFPLHY